MPISSPPVGYNLDRPGTSGQIVGPRCAILDANGETLPFGEDHVGQICVQVAAPLGLCAVTSSAAPGPGWSAGGRRVAGGWPVVVVRRFWCVVGARVVMVGRLVAGPGLVRGWWRSVGGWWCVGRWVGCVCQFAIGCGPFGCVVGRLIVDCVLVVC